MLILIWSRHLVFIRNRSSILFFNNKYYIFTIIYYYVCILSDVLIHTSKNRVYVLDVKLSCD